MVKWKWGQFKSSGFQNKHQDGCLEISPDAGKPFKRLRFSDVSDIVQGTITLDKRDYIDFMSWYKNEIKQGAVPFIFHDIRYGLDRTARITGIPSYSVNSMYFDVSLSIVFEPQIYHQDRYLTANYDIPLEADGKLLTISKKLHL